MDNGKLTVFKFTRDGGSALFARRVDEGFECIGTLGIGDKVTVECVEMDRETFERLPEWDGF